MAEILTQIKKKLKNKNVWNLKNVLNWFHHNRLRNQCYSLHDAINERGYCSAPDVNNKWLLRDRLCLRVTWYWLKVLPGCLFAGKFRLVIAMTASPDNVNIAMQPNMAQQQNQMMMPQGVMVPQGLPPGLAYLGALDEVRIHQHLDVLEGKTWIVFKRCSKTWTPANVNKLLISVNIYFY